METQGAESQVLGDFESGLKNHEADEVANKTFLNASTKFSSEGAGYDQLVAGRSGNFVGSDSRGFFLFGGLILDKDR